MSGVNRQPTGLLGFLGIKNFGRNPGVLSDTISLTWDGRDLYLQDAAEIAQFSSSIPSVGSLPCFTPPEGEVWYCWNYAVRSATLGAGEQLDIYPAILSQNNAVVMQIGHSGTLASVAGDIAGGWTDRPLVLSKGASLGVIARHFVAGAPITYSAQLRFTRMPA